MKKNEYLEALDGLYKSETNLELVPVFKYLSELFSSKYINQEEFEFAKKYLFCYSGQRTLRDYRTTFLDAIPILFGALQNNLIDNASYHDSVYKTISMEKDKFLAQLLKSRLITLKDYINSKNSSIIKIIRDDDLPVFGASTPIRIAIRLNEMYGFVTILSSISQHSKTIIVAKGSRKYTISEKKGFFQTKRTITDENQINYTYQELIQKLSYEYGTL